MALKESSDVGYMHSGKRLLYLSGVPETEGRKEGKTRPPQIAPGAISREETKK